jgi:hypothetical protein
MTTKEVAAKFYEYMQQGDFNKIYNELFSEVATSEESPISDWPKAVGMAAIHEKGKRWNEQIDEMFGGTTAEPVVAGNYFTSFMTMDFKLKGRDRTTMEEIGFYEVKDGKIISEKFYY